MGARANFVFIRDGAATAYFDSGSAPGTLYAFAKGPVEVSAYVEGTQETSGLMEWCFAEAGYLVDFDEKIAVCHGDVYDDPPENQPDPVHVALQRGPLEYLKLAAPAWPGWQLVFDARGNDAFAAHLERRQITSIAPPLPTDHSDADPPVSLQA